jgi:carboxylesterase type B
MELIQGYWYNFCKNGDPNGEKLPEWKQYAKDFDINELGNNTHMITDSEQQAKYAYYYNKLSTKQNVSPIRLGSLAKI